MKHSGGKYPAAVFLQTKRPVRFGTGLLFVLAVYEPCDVRNQFLFVLAGEGGVNRVFSVHHETVKIQDGHCFKVNIIFIVQQVVNGHMEEVGDMLQGLKVWFSQTAFIMTVCVGTDIQLLRRFFLGKLLVLSKHTQSDAENGLSVFVIVWHYVTPAYHTHRYKRRDKT